MGVYLYYNNNLNSMTTVSILINVRGSISRIHHVISDLEKKARCPLYDI